MGLLFFTNRFLVRLLFRFLGRFPVGFLVWLLVLVFLFISLGCGYFGFLVLGGLNLKALLKCTVAYPLESRLSV